MVGERAFSLWSGEEAHGSMYYNRSYIRAQHVKCTVGGGRVDIDQTILLLLFSLAGGLADCVVCSEALACVHGRGWVSKCGRHKSGVGYGAGCAFTYRVPRSTFYPGEHFHTGQGIAKHQLQNDDIPISRHTLVGLLSSIVRTTGPALVLSWGVAKSRVGEREIGGGLVGLLLLFVGERTGLG